MAITISHTLYGHPINFVVGYCIAAAPDPARDYWCEDHSIETQATLSRLNPPRIFCSTEDTYTVKTD